MVLGSVTNTSGAAVSYGAVVGRIRAMSTSHLRSQDIPLEIPTQRSPDQTEGPPLAERPVHQIAKVRRRQGVSIRGVSRQLKVSVRELKQQEDERADISLTQLFAWQKALDVPIAELLVDGEEPLSAPVLQRARMVRMMKTVAAILDRANNPAVRRLAQTLSDQLVELMPELAEVNAWHAVGQRRTTDDYGRVVERRFPSSLFGE